MPPLTLSALVSLSLAAPVPTPPEDGLKQLPGTWVLTQCTWNGNTIDYTQSIARGEENLVIIDTQNSRIEMSWASGGTKAVFKILKLRDGLIDLEPQDGAAPPLKGRKVEGIYSLEGDVLKICYGAGPPEAYNPPLKRPTEFKAPKDSDYYLRIMKRKR
jgi:uncharacterized protein (TIGR03067 family)